MARYDTIIGLDIGTQTVKAAWCGRRGRQPAVRRTEILKLARDRGDAREMLLSWIKKTGLTSTPCATAIRGGQAMFQPFVLAPDDPRTPEQAAPMEVLKFNEVAAEAMTYGFASFELSPDKRTLLLAMARESVVQDALRMGRDAELDVVELPPSPVALFNVFEGFASRHDRPVMYVNIGQSNTEVAIGTSEGLMFARAFAGGGQIFTDALAAATGESPAQAENTKLREGSLEKDDAVAAALKTGAEAWCGELQSCFSVYRSIFADDAHAPERVVLCGGGSKLQGLPALVSAGLAIDTVQQAAGIKEAPKRVNLTDFGVAIGLAMSGLGIAPAPISLLPEDVRDELTFRRQKPFWIASAVVAGLILAVSLVGGFRDIRRKETELRAQRASLRQRQQLVAEIESVREGIDHMRQLAVPLRDILRSGPAMRELLNLLAEHKAEDDWITMISDAESYFAPEPTEEQPPAQPRSTVPDRRRSGRRESKPEQDKAEEPTGIQRVIIEGYTKNPDLSTVKQLIAKLADSERVASADLLSDDKLALPSPARKARDAKASMFVIDCELAAP